MNKVIFIIAILLTQALTSGFSQTGSVYGVVTDSLTGQPVVNLTVFIPSTTSGTTTDEKGEYHLGRLSPGDYVLMFRHVSYPSFFRLVTIASGKEVVLNLAIAEQSKKLAEVVVVGKLPDRRLGYHLFKKYFLGDDAEVYCVLENPQDLKFYYQGDILMASAKQPLKIVNRHLGYRVTYFLDYFKYFDTRDTRYSYDEQGYFGYAGSALFEDLSAAMPLNKFGWRFARNSEFRGSLRHFLACLNRDELAGNHYFVRRAFHGINELQQIEKQSNAMTKIHWALMDSLSGWNHVTGKPETLYYYPQEEFVLKGIPVVNGTSDTMKSLSTDAFLLVFSDYKKTKDLTDDFISTLRFPKQGITFDAEGNYWADLGDLNWVNLDNSLQIKRLLPYDFISKIKVVRDSL